MQRGAPAISIRQEARLAGLLYLLVILLGGFAEVGVRQGLIVPGDPAATALAIKAHESSRFKGGWGSSAFDTKGAPAREIRHSEACYACHEQHAAADTTFVQFYPTLLLAATRLGT